MAFRNMRVALLLGAMIASPFLLVGRTQAQGSCDQTFDQIERNNRAFEEEAKKQSADFLIDDGVDSAISGAQKILKTTTTPTRGSASQMETYKTTIETWEKVQETFGVTLKDLEACIMPGSGCSMMGFLAKQNEALRRWTQGFLGEGTSAALDRVRSAQSLVQKNVTQLAGNAVGSMAAAAKCIGDYQQRAQANEPVDASTPPTQQPPHGGGGSTALKVGVTVGAALGAGLVLKSALDSIKTDTLAADTTTTTPTGGSASATYRAQVTDTCTSGANGDVFLGQLGTPCSKVVGGACGAAPAAFNFNVTNGAVTGQCWLSDARVTSGTYTGLFTWSTCDNKTVSGSLPGTWTMACTEGSTRPASHRVTIVVTKQ